MKTVLVTSFDKNYIVPSQVSLKSLSNNYHGINNLKVVCLVSPDILDYQESYIKTLAASNLDIEFRCSPEYIKMVQANEAHSYEHISMNCNHRIFLGSVLADYDRVIYIDSDIVVCRDVEPLINFKQTNKLHAIEEFHSMNVQVFNDPDRAYFNNGIFIADLNYWRDSNAENKMLDFIRKYGPTRNPEQDAMNYVFLDVWSPLAFSFNSFHYWMSDPELAVFAKLNSNPMIVHFAGEDKPWVKELNTKWSNLWHTVYKQMYKNKIDNHICQDCTGNSCKVCER